MSAQSGSGRRQEPPVSKAERHGPLASPKLPDGISRCGLLGYHAYMAGPCFETLEDAVGYKASLDAEGIRWRKRS